MPWQCHPPVHSECTGDRFGVVIVIVIGVVVVLICACDGGDDGDYGDYDCCCCCDGRDGKSMVVVVAVVVQLRMTTNRKRDAESSCCLGFFGFLVRWNLSKNKVFCSRRNTEGFYLAQRTYLCSNQPECCCFFLVGLL